jgi:hypothetical protein
MISCISTNLGYLHHLPPCNGNWILKILQIPQEEKAHIKADMYGAYPFIIPKSAIKPL